MKFFDNEIADLLQHIAIFLEIAAVLLVVYDYKHHKKDRGLSGVRIATGGMISGIADRSAWFRFGIFFALTAIAMELYQLLCIYLAPS